MEKAKNFAKVLGFTVFIMFSIVVLFLVIPLGIGKFNEYLEDDIAKNGIKIVDNNGDAYISAFVNPTIDEPLLNENNEVMKYSEDINDIHKFDFDVLHKDNRYNLLTITDKSTRVKYQYIEDKDTNTYEKVLNDDSK